MVKIEVRAKVNPTEERSKVAAAVANIIDLESGVEDVSGEDYLYFTSGNINSLKPLYDKLRDQKILEAARSALLSAKTPESLVFHLNKQAAYVNRLHLCGQSGESPLGPITIAVRSKNIVGFIEWLTPPTVKGKPVTLGRELLLEEGL